MRVAKLLKKESDYFVKGIFLTMYNGPGQAVLTRETFATKTYEFCSKSWDKV